MSDVLILLAPLFLLVIVAWFGFTGCGKPLPPPDDPVTPSPTPTPTPEPYATIVKKTTGFVALWPMNETAGTVAAADSLLANINAVYAGAVKLGQAGAFSHKEPLANFAPLLDGASGYADVPFNENLNVDGRFSVELWVRLPAPLAAGAEQIVVSSHHTASGGNQRGYEIALIGNAAGHATVQARVFSIADGTKSVDVTPTLGKSSDWQHIVFTYDAPVEVLTLYATVTGTVFDKAAAKQKSGKYSPLQKGTGSERPLRFGAGQQASGAAEKFFSGNIDEVAYYNVVVPDVTVEAHFKAF